jgi:hypothetical protein
MPGVNFEGRHAGNFTIAATATAVVLPAGGGFETLVVTNPSATATLWFCESDNTAAIPTTDSWGSAMRAVAPGTTQAFALAPSATGLSMISSSGSVVATLAVGRGQ